MIIPQFYWTFTNSNPSEFKLLVLIFTSSMQIPTLLHALDCMELSPTTSHFIEKVSLEPMPDGLNVYLVPLIFELISYLLIYYCLPQILSQNLFVWGLLKDRNQCVSVGQKNPLDGCWLGWHMVQASLTIVSLICQLLVVIMGYKLIRKMAD